MTQQRAQHYLFAHMFFPNALLGRPDRTLLAIARSDRADEFLASTWRSAERATEPAGRLQGPPPRTALRVDGDGGGMMWIIEMPPAEAPPEAHAIAVVFLDDPDRFAMRYFTLEKSFDGTVIGGWAFGTDNALKHLNFGAGPPAGNARAFAEAVARLPQGTGDVGIVQREPDRRPADRIEPRPQIAILVHNVLRDMAIREAEPLHRIAVEKDPQALVDAIWKDVTAFAEGQGAPLVNGHPQAEKIAIGEHDALLVTVPGSGENEMESFFCCAVFSVDKRGLFGTTVTARYFTLDRNYSRESGAPLTMLGGWEPTTGGDIRRVHHKPGVAADRASFLDAVEATLAV